MYSWEGHGFYLAPQILLAIFYNRKLSDFQETRENIVYENNSGGFWCNMASEQYKKFVTDTEISAEVDLDKAIDVLREEGFVWSEYYSEYILIDDSSCCEDCEDYFYNDDMEEGSDGCLYCSDCIHDHLEDEEEIA